MKMRDPNRIYPMMCEIAELWQKHVPDWRFGQLMYNFMASCGDPFYWEDDRFVKKLKEYLENNC